MRSGFVETAWRMAWEASKIFFSVALTVLGLMLITFFIGRVMPLDPVLAIVGDRASEETYRQVYLQLGLDKSLPEQFWIYLKNIFSGDFGQSIMTGQPVIEDITRFFPATFELATLGIIIGIMLGIPAGVWAAVRQGKPVDHIVRLIGLLGYSAPVFWLGLMGLLIFYAQLGWVGGPGRLDLAYMDIVEPITGALLLDSALVGEWEVFWNAFSHIILPASLLGYLSMAYISRMTRSFMLEQLRQEYVTAARVKGMRESRVIWRHAFRNVAVPLVTVVALSYAKLLEGSVLTETVFAWPGLGLYITNSLFNADMNAVIGGTIVVGLVFIGFNLLSDLLYRWLDPRTRS